MESKKNNENSIAGSKSMVAEAYRTLRTNIQFSGVDQKIQTLLFTSANPNEGKTTIAINLAYTFVLTGITVLLVDCDLRSPSLKRELGYQGNAGLTNVISNTDITYQDVLFHPGEMPGLDVLCSGPIPPNPAELLGSRKMKTILELFKRDYDLVVLDCGPIGLVTDAAILSTIVDGTIIVCAQNRTEMEQLLDAKHRIDQVKGKLLGVVLNRVKTKTYKNYGNYFTY